MIPKVRNIIIFIAIGLALVAVYFFFIRQPASVPDLVSTTPAATSTTTVTGGDNEIAQSFLTLLLNIKTIKLNDAILSDVAFTSLHDSTITLTPDNNTGRPNPFAPLGTDAVPTSTTPVTTQTTTPPTATTAPASTTTTPSNTPTTGATN